MITIFQGEQRNGRMKYTTDRDCLAPNVIRVTERVFPSMDAVMLEARSLELRGWKVCVDTEDTFYEVF